MISTLVDAALRSLLLAAAVWAGLRVFRVRNVIAGKAAWALVLSAAILMPALVPIAARWHVLPAGAQVVLPASPMTLLEEIRATLESRRAIARPASKIVTPVPQPKTAQTDETVTQAPAETDDAVAPKPEETSSYEVSPAPYVAPPVAARSMLPSPLVMAIGFYLAVALMLAGRLVYGLGVALLLWHRAKPAAIPGGTEVPVRTSPEISSPVTIGSGVVLPAEYTEWDQEKLRVVLAHERSHVNQRDFYLQLIAGLYAAAFWISPLGWWLKRKLSDLAEAISDCAALSEAASRPAYAQILLEFAAVPRPTLIGVAMARSSRISDRIERLLNESSFHQAFASTRRRAALAVLLVPIALFAVAGIRVEAAGQETQEPSPAVAPSPAAAPAPSAAPQVSVAPQAPDAEPAPAMDDDQEGPVVAPAVPDVPPAPDVFVAVPPVPAVPVAPEVEGVTVIPPSAVLALQAPVAPMPPTSWYWNPKPLHLPGKTMMFAGGPDGLKVLRLFPNGQVVSADGRGYAYVYSRNGDSYALISGNARDHFQFSGDMHTEEIEKAKKLAKGDFLWFRHDGKSYLIDDPVTISQIEAMYKPVEELGKQQEELGRQQEELGKQQEALGRKQEQVNVPTPDLSKEVARMNEALAKLQQLKNGQSINRDDLARLQGEIGELQSELGALQGQMGAQQGELGEEQGKLGAQQGRLGAEQGRLGAEQGRLSREIDLKVKGVIDESLKNGKAKPVE
ncbi:MAG TPA: M56 family metallopeptidase [Terracidiphilus sp.]|nr:M56 family metallopeptidase [Terracidiphilus sp.]